MGWTAVATGGQHTSRSRFRCGLALTPPVAGSSRELKPPFHVDGCVKAIFFWPYSLGNFCAAEAVLGKKDGSAGSATRHASVLTLLIASVAPCVSG